MKTPIGIDKTTGEIRSIRDVETNGLACNCRCPNEACGADLVARFCKEKENHFAHHRKKGGTACQEKALHLLAKHLIVTRGASLFPVLTLDSTQCYSYLNELYEDSEEYFGTVTMLRRAREEVNLPEFAIKPDILCETTLNGVEVQLAIEVKVTHEVDDEKLSKIEKANLTAFEIDLSNLVSLSELTTEQVEQALAETYRYKWLHVEAEVKEGLQRALDERVRLMARKRNDEINDWQNSVTAFLTEKGHISLPRYQYPEIRIKPEITDLGGFTHKVRLPKPPSLQQKITVSDIAPLKDGVMVLETRAGNRRFPLPVIFVEGPFVEGPLTGSYLQLDYGRGLPDCHKFESRLQWGRSEKAERYVSKVTRLKHEAKVRKDREVKTRIERRLKEYQQIVESGSYPRSGNAPQIARDYETACEELMQRGINREAYMADLPESWIFGCPQEHWQTLLLRALCVVNNELADVKYFANSLKNYHSIEALEPVKSLGYLKRAMEQLKYPPNDVPTTFGVIISYFDALCRKGHMRYAGRGNYLKSMPYGPAYRQVQQYYRS